MIIFFLILAQYISIVWSLHFNTSYRLRWFVVVNMILVMFLWSKLIDVFWITSSIGSLFYSTIFIIQTLLFMKEGRKFFLRGLNMSLFNFIAVVFVLLFTVYVPTIPGNENFAEAVNLISNEAIGIASGAFLSFYFAQFVLLYLLESCQDLKINNYFWYIVSVSIASMLESFIYSFIVFWHNWGWWSLMWWGWILKMFFTFSYIPIIFLAKKTYFIRPKENDLK